MDRLNDPVWQAFERDPLPDAKPLTEEQLRKRERGLREMRQGLFMKIEQLVR